MIIGEPTDYRLYVLWVASYLSLSICLSITIVITDLSFYLFTYDGEINLEIFCFASFIISSVHRSSLMDSRN